MKKLYFLPLFVAMLALGGCNAAMDGIVDTPDASFQSDPTRPIGGLIAPESQTINSGHIPALLENVMGASGIFGIYQWQSSTDNVNWVNIFAAESPSYQPGPLTETTYFRRTISGPQQQYACSNTAVVFVDPNKLSVPIISSSQPTPQSPPGQYLEVVLKFSYVIV